MATLGNIVWFILIGWWNFILYAITGLGCFITIIGIPVGKSMFQYAKLMALPFGKEIVRETFIKGEENVSGVRKFFGVIANLIWLPFGLVLFLLNIPTIIVGVITIVGIPGAVVLARSCKFLLWPVGAKVITKQEADAIRMSRTVNEAVSNQLQNYERVHALETANVEKASTAVIVQESVAANKKAASEKSGPSAFDNFKESCGTAAAAVAATTKATGSKIKEKKDAYTNEVLSRENSNTFKDLMTLLEVILFKNPVTAWIMTFLEAITGAVMAVCLAISIIFAAVGRAYFVFNINYYIAPFMIILIIFTVIKRSNICFLTEMAFEIIISILMHRWFYAIAFAAITVWYVIAIMKGVSLPDFKKVALVKNGVPVFEKKVKIEDAVIEIDNSKSENKFCSNCGATIVEGAKFCAKCGTMQ